MRTCILISLFCALIWQVVAEGENEIKRGIFPFMAFVYYPDELVAEGTGERFLRGAVLIRPDWLVTSAVGPSVINNVPSGFPRKTLLARLGAISIDANFTLNEDEDEQEREIIQIVRPYNHSATQWWQTDISLMKTLLPFNTTTAVGPTSLSYKHDSVQKTCNIIVFAKRYGNASEDRILMQLSVELLPPSIENCGSHFAGPSMTCAADSEENKNVAYDQQFCQGNSGGPLICEGQVTGLQTYIDNNCKQPHLYQLTSAWENFITCGIEDRCNEEQCSNICDVANKDPPVLESFVPYNIMDDKDNLPSESMPSSTVAHVDIFAAETPTLTSVSTEQSTESSETNSTLTATTTLEQTDGETKVWPKHAEGDTSTEVERKANVEAQQQQVNASTGKVKLRSNAHRNMCILQLFFGLFTLACLI